MQFLIIKTSSLGDIIQAFPVASYLHEKFPGCSVDWVVEKSFSALVTANPQIRKVYHVDTKKWRKTIFSQEGLREIRSFRHAIKSQYYDLVIDIQGNTKSGLITWQAQGAIKIGFGKSTVPELTNLLFTHKRYNPPTGMNIRKDYLSIVQQHFSDSRVPSSCAVECILSDPQQEQVKFLLADPKGKSSMKIMVCPGSAWKNKQLSPDVLKDVLQRIAGMYSCSFFFLWGNEKEKAVTESLHREFPQRSVIIGFLPLPALQSLLSEMELVISMDSLPLHLAGITSVPTFSFFGPSSSNKYKPEGSEHFSLTGACPYGRTFEKRCPILRTCETGACIHSLRAEDIFREFQAWWKTL
jgi:heptosyltransferase-1